MGSGASNVDSSGRLRPHPELLPKQIEGNLPGRETENSPAKDAPIGRSFARELQRAVAGDCFEIARMPHAAALTHTLIEQVEKLSYHDYVALLGLAFQIEQSCGKWNNKVERLQHLDAQISEYSQKIADAPHSALAVAGHEAQRLREVSRAAIKEDLGNNPPERVLERVNELFCRRALLTHIDGEPMRKVYLPGGEMVAALSTITELFECCCGSPPRDLRDGKGAVGTFVPVPDQNFASDLRMLLRLSFPGGVNVANPQGVENHFQNFAADQRLDLSWIGTRIHVLPGENNSQHSLVVAYSGHVKSTLRLKDGESLFIGRDLRIKELFGIAFPSHPLSISADVHLSDSHHSRIGLEIRRNGNRITVLDRGSKNAITLSQESVRSALTVVFQPGGPEGLGLTNVTIRPKGKLGVD